AAFPNPTATKGDMKMGVFTDFINNCQDIRVSGSAALDLAYVAAGRIDGYWNFGLTEWEVAAASLMVQEAGGIIDDMKGQQKFLTDGNVIAASPKIFKQMAKTIQPNLKS
ncbi:MAG: myo-inositol-1(or 4)-monophosphatase, partial [Enterobacterales bacterium]